MTLAELIEKLEDIRSQNADNVPVVVENSRGGFQDIVRVYPKEKPNKKTGWMDLIVVIGD